MMQRQRSSATAREKSLGSAYHPHNARPPTSAGGAEAGSNHAEARASNHGERGLARAWSVRFLAPQSICSWRRSETPPKKRWPEVGAPGHQRVRPKEAVVPPKVGESHGAPALSRSGRRGARPWSCEFGSAVCASPSSRSAARAIGATAIAASSARARRAERTHARTTGATSARATRGQTTPSTSAGIGSGSASEKA
jgi:hypothetical protein